MPTKRNTRSTRQAGRPRRTRGSMAGSILYHGKLELPISASTTASAANLHAFVSAGSQFLQTVGDCFQMYRFEKLSLKLYPFADHTVADGTLAVGYQPEITDTLPTTISEVLNMPQCQLVTDGQTVPVTLNVPKSALMTNQNKFWRTQLPSQTNTGSGNFATSNFWETVQGAFWFLATGSLTLTSILNYTIRLISPVAPAQTPRPARPRVEALLGHHYLGFERLQGQPVSFAPDGSIHSIGAGNPDECRIPDSAPYGHLVDGTAPRLGGAGASSLFAVPQPTKAVAKRTLHLA
jgi:hypothetical protein